MSFLVRSSASAILEICSWINNKQYRQIKALFSSSIKILYLPYQVFEHMYEVLNIDEK
jgi:hypothetical protein